MTYVMMTAQNIKVTEIYYFIKNLFCDAMLVKYFVLSYTISDEMMMSE